MSSPFIGEIRMFGGNFAPRGWATCDGQLLPISQNTALFSILGTNYGGNGTTTFALPDMRNSVPVAAGQGPGLSLYDLGQSGGESTVTLIASQVASHNHVYNCGTGGRGAVTAVSGNVNTDAPALTNLYAATSDGTVMSPTMLSPTAGSLPHDNMQPYQGLTFIIALVGVFPARN
jgi:microcystin-dependent protein